MLDDGDLAVGSHTISYNGSFLPSGVYLLRLETPDAVSARKVALMK